MAAKRMPDAAYARECVRYNPLTGEFFWIRRPRAHFPDQGSYNSWNTIHPGKPAGTIKADGYVRLRIQREHYTAHRLAWLLEYGEPVPSEIDHINGGPGDNRLLNLRAARREGNTANARKPRNNTSGVKGVKLQEGRYIARIIHQGRYIHIGCFNTLEEAAAARRGLAEQLHGEFVRHE